jgi:hypothetical protein
MHEMTLQRSYPSGATEWRCAQCGRHTVMAPLAAGQRLRIVELEAGDTAVAHATNRGGLQIGKASASEATPLPPSRLLH